MAKLRFNYSRGFPLTLTSAFPHSSLPELTGLLAQFPCISVVLQDDSDSAGGVILLTSPEEKAGRSERPVRVLIVDDDHGFRTFIRRVLDNEMNLSVVSEAMDGKEAVDKSVELKPDLVLMDMDLPRIDGLEATRQIKTGLPGTVVIMFSPLEGTEYREATARSGADDFLVKTAEISQILATIRRCMPGKPTATGSMGRGKPQ